MQCVVFDMDGVLFDSEKLVLQCWEQTAQAHHIPDIQTACRSCLGSNAASARQKFLEKYGADFPYDTYKQEMSARYWQQVETGKLELKPGVQEMLQFLREQHIPAAIASSTRRAAVRQQITLFGLQDFFCKIIGGDMVQQSKPHPEIYQTACAAMDVPPACAYAVEDSYNGIRAASRAGMHPIMIPDLLPPTPEMEQLAEQIFPDMAAFQAFLKASQKK
ncbi:MAG: HAD family hydrolase [Ruminococcus sp.]|jgi:HAD superfamily hydrolase (TIGR01509 family)|uniref:HAD family hydrolase n=1 Tax=uncultured Ruminococcus sp. TaxID=165186 RepID=UPI002603FD18|nr:HAD family phosphatase [uncultured Ruminococcus sp.]